MIWSRFSWLDNNTQTCYNTYMNNESLKTVENMVELVYAELKRNMDNLEVTDKSFHLLKEAAIATINLKRKIESARAWNVQA